MNTENIPATLNEAMATEPMWLQLWIVALLVANLGAVFFVVGKSDGSWQVRTRPIAILLGFFAAAAIMNWLYGQYGYVRLLGLAHLIAWLPAYIYVLLGRREIGITTFYGKYIAFYIVIAGLSLIIDAVDVVRYLIGDGELFMRWSEGAK